MPHLQHPGAASGRALLTLLGATALFLAGCGTSGAGPTTLNGFELEGSLVPTGQIKRGGPPRDGIPALTDPEFVPSTDAHWLSPDDRILGVAMNGEARAYPLNIMNWHEIVNDRFGDDWVAVTYCPLCFSGMAFAADNDGDRMLFGVSGLLYNSDVLMYDHATESLWSQISATAITGPHRGDTLEAVPLANTTWGAWREQHPESEVLSRDTGYRRDYDRDPYGAYAESREIMFPVEFRARGYHPKERVIGLDLDGAQKAWPFVELRQTDGRIEDRVGERTVLIEFDDATDTATAYDTDGRELASLTAYWFAWYAFHPETAVFSAD